MFAAIVRAHRDSILSATWVPGRRAESPDDAPIKAKWVVELASLDEAFDFADEVRQTIDRTFIQIADWGFYPGSPFDGQPPAPPAKSWPRRSTGDPVRDALAAHGIRAVRR